jgi:single-strand DNA-binding protein
MSKLKSGKEKRHRKMAGSINKAILIGHLGADPVTRRTQEGKAIASFRIATSESWKDKSSGEKREKTEWHSIVIYNDGLAQVAEKYLKKGSKVYVEGALQTKKWTDKDNVERYSTEVALQAFNGTLVLLDAQKGDRAPQRDAGAYEGDEGPY